eukprot:m.229598 g.229598  ORF g.229598 m.229598 type:complete len:142 (-) comp17342_c0_seq3:1888-2313(-)
MTRVSLVDVNTQLLAACLLALSQLKNSKYSNLNYSMPIRLPVAIVRSCARLNHWFSCLGVTKLCHVPSVFGCPLHEVLLTFTAGIYTGFVTDVLDDEARIGCSDWNAIGCKVWPQMIEGFLGLFSPICDHLKGVTMIQHSE